jgi:uncharacterized protein involved in exopolysaccharide biosynthesis
MTSLPPADEGTADEQLTLREIGAVVRAFGRFVARYLATIGIGAAVAVLLGVLYVAASTSTFRASTRMLPYRPANSGLVGVGGLATIAGVNLPIAGSAQVVSADLYPEVATSLTFRVRLARTPIRFLNGKYTFEQYFDSVYRPSVLERAGQLAGTVRAAISGSGSESQSRPPGGADSVPWYSQKFLLKLHDLKARVRTEMDRKTSIITITVDMPDPVAAADLANATAALLTREIIAYESNRAVEVAASLVEQQSSAERRYRVAQAAIVDFNNRNRVLSIAGSAELRNLNLEFDLAADLYKSVTSQLEAAKVREKENTPVLTVLEPGIVPNSRSSPRLKLTVVVAFILGVVGTTGFLVVRHWDALAAIRRSELEQAGVAAR